MLGALDQLEQHGCEFPARRITVLARDDKRTLGDRIAATVGQAEVARASLEHPYYNQGIEIPLIDGGAFDWVARLTANRRAVYVASGFGSQLAPLMFRRIARTSRVKQSHIAIVPALRSAATGVCSRRAGYPCSEEIS